MVRYNIYIFDCEGGLLIGYHPFEAADDSAALVFAAAFSARRPMELWREETLVESWRKDEPFGSA